MKLEKGYYTCDICETYWYVNPVYRGANYTKAKVEMFYKSGQYKGYSLGSKKYKLYHDRIKHWEKYND